MTAAEHEARIDMCERRMLDPRSSHELRRLASRAFCAAIAERNAERTPAEIAELERSRGLRT